MTSENILKELAYSIEGLEQASTDRTIRNRRRKVLGVIRKLRNYVDKKRPSVKPKKTTWEKIWAQAKVYRPNRFELRVIRPGRLEFTLERAQEFVERWVRFINHGKKEGERLFEVYRVTHNVPRHCNYVGQLNGKHKEIRILRAMRDSDKWRTLIHEVAHYRVRPHRRAFVLEMAKAYSEYVCWRIEEGCKKRFEQNESEKSGS